MSSRGCKRMSRDQIQKQPTVRASLGRYKEVPQIVCTCTKHRTHARTHTHTHTFALIHKPKTHARAHTHSRAHTHTPHTRLHYFRSLSVSLSPPHEKLSPYHPRTALVPFLSSQKPFPLPLGYPQTKALKMCWIGTKNSQILFWLASFVLMSLYKDVENIVKWCPGIKFKSRRDFGPLFKSVQGGATHWYKHKKRLTHANTHTHARTRARTNTHTHTHRQHYFQSLCFPISATREKFKVPSTYRPGTFSIHSETLSCTSRGHTHTHTNGLRQVFDR